jgi:hypothetical protein
MLEIDDNRAAYDERHRHGTVAARRQNGQALRGQTQDANDTTDGVPKECPSTGIPRKCGRCELVTT